MRDRHWKEIKLAQLAGYMPPEQAGLRASVEWALEELAELRAELRRREEMERDLINWGDLFGDLGGSDDINLF